jgi:hypothetical protein
MGLGLLRNRTRQAHSSHGDGNKCQQKNKHSAREWQNQGDQGQNRFYGIGAGSITMVCGCGHEKAFCKVFVSNSSFSGEYGSI